MNSELAFSIISFIFVSGVVYGTLNNRIKTLEKLINDSKDIVQRLAKIEAQIEFLINNIKK